MYRKIRKLLAFVMILLMLESLCPLVFSEETSKQEEETIWLTGLYTSPGDDVKLRSWQFPYSDSYFEGEDNVYLHGLAQASLGMAVSAFRNKMVSFDRQAENVQSYLSQAGFTDMRPEGYDQPTSQDTISTLIAQKQIGNMTVLAVAVCGGGYGNEWKSNFLVGNGIRSEGFNNASQLVQQRIREYVDGYHLTGDIRLWIAGFSRAAAVSNITAADMTDSGLFTQVYAYTFATPNVTREPGDYRNIFNIIGKTDPVPCVPLRDWGYCHYGIDLYTPAQEFDSDYAQKAAASNEVSLRLTGKPFRNNPFINYTLRNVLDFLLAAYPSSDIYQPTLGQSLIELWGGDEKKIDEVVQNALKDADSMPKEQAEEFSQLVNYVQDTISYQIRTRERMVGLGLWDKNVSLADNVAHEHNPDVYIDWLFSTDDPEQLFCSEADSYYRLILLGSVTVDIYDAYGFVQRILPDGSVSTDSDRFGKGVRIAKDSPKLFSNVESKTLTVVIPRDRLYALSISSKTAQEIQYLTAVFGLGGLRSEIGNLHTLTLMPDEEYYIIASDEFASLDENRSELITNISTLGHYSPSLLIQAESMNIFNLTLPELVVFIFLMMLVVDAFLLIELILLIIRLIRHKRRKLWVTLVIHGMVTIFFYVLTELSRYHLNAITMAYIAMKSLAALSTAILSLKAACVSKTRLGWFVFAAMLFALCGDISSYPTLSIACFAFFLLMLLIGLYYEKRFTRRRLIVALVLWLIYAVAILLNWHQVGNLLGIFLAYSALQILLPVMSWRVHPLLFVGSILFATSNLILGINMVFQYGFLFRAIGVGNYLLSTFLIAMSPFFFKKKAMIEPANSETGDE